MVTIIKNRSIVLDLVFSVLRPFLKFINVDRLIIITKMFKSP